MADTLRGLILLLLVCALRVEGLCNHSRHTSPLPLMPPTWFCSASSWCSGPRVTTFFGYARRGPRDECRSAALRIIATPRYSCIADHEAK